MRGGMTSFLIWTVVAYVLFCGILFGYQRSLLYHPNQTIPDPKEFGLEGISVERIESDGGHRLLAWWRPPASVEKPVILYFHGNAGHLGHRAEKVRPYLVRGYGLLLTTYRYNAGAGGSPSEAGLYADGRATMAYARRKGIASDRFIIYGESLGTAVAVTTAAEYDVGAVVLEAPYTSIADVSQTHYWYLPARYLVLDKFDVAKTITHINAPLMIVHGERDAIIPARFGKKLFEKALEPKEARFLAEAGHDNLHEHGIAQIVIEFAERHLESTNR